MTKTLPPIQPMKIVAIASKDGADYQITAFVPQDWTEWDVRDLVAEVKAELYTKDSHPDEYDADEVIRRLAKRGIPAGTMADVDTAPVVWDQWNDLKE